MALFSYFDTSVGMIENGLIPVFFNEDLETSKGIIGAVAEGGSTHIEWTNRGDFADELFGELMKWVRKNYADLILGVGSVEDAPTAISYMQKGAEFVVGPVSRKEVAIACNRRNIPYSPGCATPTEVLEAEENGAVIIKVFPGQILTSAFIKAHLGPRRRSLIMPTGGVQATAESIYEWISAGAVSLGIGSDLISRSIVANKDWEALREDVRKCLHWVKVSQNKVKAENGEIFVGIHHAGVVTEDLDQSVKALGTVGFKVRQRTSTAFVTLGKDELELGPPGRVKEHGHLAIEVTDLDEAMEILKGQGISCDGEPTLSPNKQVKIVYLAGTPWGLKTPVHLFCRYSEEIERIASK